MYAFTPTPETYTLDAFIPTPETYALLLLDAAAPLASLCVAEHDSAGADGTPYAFPSTPETYIHIHPYT